MKSNECRSALRNLKHSNPYNSIGKQLDLTSSRITTSEARFSSLPNAPLTGPKNDRYVEYTASNYCCSDVVVELRVTCAIQTFSLRIHVEAVERKALRTCFILLGWLCDDDIHVRCVVQLILNGYSHARTQPFVALVMKPV